MQRKFIVISIIAVLVLGITTATVIALKNDSNTVETKAEVSTLKTYSYITEEMLENTQSLETDLCLVEEYEPNKLQKDADAIVIATVVSIDKATANEGLFGMTKGKIVVKNSLYGKLKEGQVVEYAKNGGIFSMSEWEKTQPDAANQKRAYLRKQAGVEMDLDNTYISVELSDDVEISEGTTYLMYLKKYQDSYEIIGLDVGLREVDMPKVNEVTTQKIETTDLKIKNNKTGEFESLENYIKTYITSSNE